MTHLEWREAPEGWECGDYFIRRLDGRCTRWLLESVDGPASSLSNVRQISSVHTSLRAAKTEALRSERDRVRRTRERADRAVAIASSAAFVVLIPSMESLLVFVAGMFSLSLALRSSVDAVSGRIGSAWEWSREINRPERITWSARLAMAAIETSDRRAATGRRGETPPAVRVLPPAPFD